MMFQLLLSSAYSKSRTLFFACSASEEIHKKLGGRAARTADLNRRKDIPSHRMSCSIYTWGIHWKQWHFSPQVTIVCDGPLFLWRRLNTCLLMCESIPWFFLLPHAVFALLIKLCLSQPMRFFTFTPLILSLIQLREIKRVTVMVSCRWGLNHNTR